eukprot:38879-Rhodomonas_salina.1
MQLVFTTIPILKLHSALQRNPLLIGNGARLPSPPMGRFTSAHWAVFALGLVLVVCDESCKDPAAIPLRPAKMDEAICADTAGQDLNTRTDKWRGASLENRARLTREVAPDASALCNELTLT